MTSEQLPWADPRQYAAALKDEKDLILLYSGMEPGRYSILAWGLKQKITDIEKLQNELTTGRERFDNAWFGWLGYGLRHWLEKLPHNEASIIPLPDMLMMSFANLAVFDHKDQTITSNIRITPSVIGKNTLSGVDITSNMSDKDFKEKVAYIVEKINQGELYQANLTRKFYGNINCQDTLALFSAICDISPAPYSSYIRHGDVSIISASPEKFITIDGNTATTVPIKGTLSAERPAYELQHSEKDKAENLMIVDLMRNDLSKTCSEVRVEKLFEVTSYAKYHHMSSTISGKITAHPVDVVIGCFPPGSMTGAPKIHAMRMISQLEGIERGVYSGAIGYFGGDGSCDLSVVIRTLIVKGNKFEFQVGCGIVADSKPENELEESFIKAKPILETLTQN